MVINSASRIIKNLLLHDLDDYLKSAYHNPRIAISPLMPASINVNATTRVILLTLSTEYRVFKVILQLCDELPGEMQKLIEHVEARQHETALILSLLFRSRFTIRVSVTSPGMVSENEMNDTLRRIDIGISDDVSAFQLSVLIPVDFLRLFSNRIKTDSNDEEIESGIINFFKHPLNMFPNLRTILKTFSDLELQNLLYQLHTGRQLTEYQLCLLVLSFPDESLRLKKNLSLNIVRDVMNLMKRIKASGRVSRRDLTGGVYSVEEAIFFLMKRGADFGYSRFLSDIRKMIKMLYSIDILLVKDFGEWIDEMRESRLLYKTISLTRDICVVHAISVNRGKYLSLFKDHFSDRRIREFSSIPIEGVSSIERMLAQSQLIEQYRVLKMKRLDLGDESFEYLLRRLSRPEDYNYLLLSVGWFVLSTALKGIRKKRIMTLLTHIPRPARYLVEDVIRGVINPNIIHDEMQIAKARRTCVQSIVTLFEDGFVQLAE